MPPEELKAGWLMRVETDGTNTLVNRVGYEGTWPANPQGQIIELLTVDAGKTNLTFKPPLYYGLGSTAKVRRQYGSASLPNYATLIGFESLRLHQNNTLADYGFRMEYVSRCWIKDCIVTNSQIAAVSLITAYRCNFESNYFTTSTMDGSGGGYGLVLQGKSTQNLVENNIFDLFAAAILCDDGSAGNVMGYNFAYRTKFFTPGWSIHSLGHHSCHPMFTLWEGNVAINLFSDFIHGSSSHQTVFRNRLYGWYTNSLTSQNICMQFHAWNQYSSIVGNVLGWTNMMTDYEMEDATMDFTKEAIYAWGYNGGNPYNANAEDTSLRHFNFDTYTLQTLGTNGGVRLDASIYPETNIVDSYYLDAKPEWMGSLAFPLIGPDVNTTDFTNIVNPAYLRYLGNTNYLTGGESPDPGGSGGGVGHLKAPSGFKSAIVNSP